MQVIWYEHLRRRKHFFHDYPVGGYDARALPVCSKKPDFSGTSLYSEEWDGRGDMRGSGEDRGKETTWKTQA